MEDVSDAYRRLTSMQNTPVGKMNFAYRVSAGKKSENINTAVIAILKEKLLRLNSEELFFHSICFARNCDAAFIRLFCRSVHSVHFSLVRNTTAPDTSPAVIIGTAAIAVRSAPSAG